MGPVQDGFGFEGGGNFQAAAIHGLLAGVAPFRGVLAKIREIKGIKHFNVVSYPQQSGQFPGGGQILGWILGPLKSYG
jgi:hypothetical protein